MAGAKRYYATWLKYFTGEDASAGGPVNGPAASASNTNALSKFSDATGTTLKATAITVDANNVLQQVATDVAPGVTPLNAYRLYALATGAAPLPANWGPALEMFAGLSSGGVAGASPAGRVRASRNGADTTFDLAFDVSVTGGLTEALRLVAGSDQFAEVQNRCASDGLPHEVARLYALGNAALTNGFGPRLQFFAGLTANPLSAANTAGDVAFVREGADTTYRLVVTRFSAGTPVNAIRVGENNTGIGSGVMAGLGAAATNNTMAGRGAAATLTGSFNCGYGDGVFGAAILINNSSGFGVGVLANAITPATANNGFGRGALAALTTGSNCCAYGNNALAKVTTDSDACAFGSLALFNQVGAASGNSAFGTSALVALTNSTHQCAFGQGALGAVTTGADGNCGFGYIVGATLTMGSNNTILGHTADVSSATASRRVALGAGSKATADNGFFVYGTASPAGVALAGIAAAANVVYDPATGQIGPVISSERYKTDIAALDYDSACVYAMLPRSFTMDAAHGGKRSSGFIAEQMEKVAPQFVIVGPDGPETVIYSELIVPVIAELQKLRARVTIVEARAAA